MSISKAKNHWTEIKEKYEMSLLLYPVDRSETTFPNLICTIKVVSGNFNLSKGKSTSLQIQSLQICGNAVMKSKDKIHKNQEESRKKI